MQRADVGFVPLADIDQLVNGVVGAVSEQLVLERENSDQSSRGFAAP